MTLVEDGSDTTNRYEILDLKVIDRISLGELELPLLDLTPSLITEFGNQLYSRQKDPLLFEILASEVLQNHNRYVQPSGLWSGKREPYCCYAEDWLNKITSSNNLDIAKLSANTSIYEYETDGNYFRNPYEWEIYQKGYDWESGEPTCLAIRTEGTEIIARFATPPIIGVVKNPTSGLLSLIFDTRNPNTRMQLPHFGVILQRPIAQNLIYEDTIERIQNGTKRVIPLS